MKKTKRKGRPVSGLLLFDKPVGLTSNAALQQVKLLYQAAKAGHTGSLDPLASGMLIICFGQATKFSQFLLDADKVYEVRAKLGICTTTGDAEGEIVAARPVPHLTPEAMEQVLEQFRGEIRQVPSMYSALKHQGKPLYEYARQGIEIPREPRRITIYELRLESLDLNTQEYCLSVRCSKGTYIRTLIEDIGSALGCGSHVTALRRLSVGKFSENEMITLRRLQQDQASLYELDQHLLPAHLAAASYPVIEVSESLQFYLRQGNSVLVAKAPSSGMVRLMTKDQRFIGVGEVLNCGKITPRKLCFY